MIPFDDYNFLIQFLGEIKRLIWQQYFADWQEKGKKNIQNFGTRFRIFQASSMEIPFILLLFFACL